MKKLIIITSIFIVLCSDLRFVHAQNNGSLKGKKIALIIAPGGFRDEEYAEPKKYFEENEATVITVSTTTEQVTGSRGMKAKPQVLLKNLDVTDYDAVVFVGGPGARKYYENKDALRITKEAYTKQKVVAAICVAPNILCKAGILKGKKATAWSFEVSECEVIKSNKSVEQDGKIITANGPHAALDFATVIGNALKEN